MKNAAYLAPASSRPRASGCTRLPCLNTANSTPTEQSLSNSCCCIPTCGRAKMNPMHAIIVDLEATSCDAGSIPSHAMEIIEFGAVAVRVGDGAPLAEFQNSVRPVRHPSLTPFCNRLTSIQQADVDGAPTFLEVVARLRAWLTPFSPYSWCSWGNYDRKQFVQECAFHHVGFPFAGPHRNLKAEFVAARARPKKLGLNEALHALGLPVHRGIDDARSIARIYLQSLAVSKKPACRKLSLILGT